MKFLSGIRNWFRRPAPRSVPLGQSSLIEPPKTKIPMPVILNEGTVKKNLNDPPTSPRPAPPRSQVAKARAKRK